MNTDRLLLRAPTPGDLGAFFRIYGDPATNTHDPLGPAPDLATAAALLGASMAHWEMHGFGAFVVSTREAPQWVIGFAGVTWRQYSDAEVLNLGYRLEPAAWGKGYATELAAESLQNAFARLGLRQVFALVRPANAASIRVLEKIGMERVGALEDVSGEVPSFVYRASSLEAPTPTREHRR